MIDLGMGGDSWDGWTFSTWGRSKEWFILDPRGHRYTAREIAELATVNREINYLRMQLKQYETFAAPDAMHFGPEDSILLLKLRDMIERAEKNISLPRLQPRFSR